MTVKQGQTPSFHVELGGETRYDQRSVALDDFSLGVLVGLLVGEGHFGGDGKQPHVTLRMHVRHERVFRWLVATFPESKLFGPYNHSGRRYFQWMARGAFLRETLVPLIAARVPDLDEHAASRFDAMCERYAIARPESTEVPVLSSPAFTAGELDPRRNDRP